MTAQETKWNRCATRPVPIKRCHCAQWYSPGVGVDEVPAAAVVVAGWSLFGDLENGDSEWTRKASPASRQDACKV